jgi:hypothetical protein
VLLQISLSVVKLILFSVCHSGRVVIQYFNYLENKLVFFNLYGLQIDLDESIGHVARPQKIGLI